MGHYALSMLVSGVCYLPATYALLKAVVNLERAYQTMLREHRAEVRVRHCAFTMAAALNLHEAAVLAETISWPAEEAELSWRQLARDAFDACQEPDLWDRALKALPLVGRDHGRTTVPRGDDVVCADPELPHLVLSLHREHNPRHPNFPNWRPKWHGRR